MILERDLLTGINVKCILEMFGPFDLCGSKNPKQEAEIILPTKVVEQQSAETKQKKG